MKENKYDDALFFQKYSEMNRSKYGLNGAGEWSEFRKLLPDFHQKRVLDLGCGYGWHCIYAAQQGATQIMGIDLSEKMLAVAKEKSTSLPIQYQCIAMEDFSASNNSFDVILSALAFHYISDFDSLIQKINEWLVPGGDFVFSVEHPVFTSYGTQDWYYNKEGEILHFPVDRYYYEGTRNAVFLGESVVKYHRTLTTYLSTLLNHGFELRQIVEPQPPFDMLDLPGMKDEMRRPMMLLISAKKK